MNFIRIFYDTIAAFLMCVQTIDAIKSDRSMRKMAVDKLLNEGYDVRLRPQYGGDPLLVGIQLEVVNIDEISEADMSFHANFYLQQTWIDERLTFNANKLKTNYLLINDESIDNIWVPDTYFANDKESHLHNVTCPNRMMKIYPNGTIVYNLRLTATLSCLMDLIRFPFDTQNCSIEIESYGYVTKDIRYKSLGKMEAVDHIAIPEFQVIAWHISSRDILFATGSYSRVSISFLFKRNLPYYLFQAFLPFCLMTLISWVIFWIDEREPSARVSLSIFTLFTITSVTSNVSSCLPKIPYVQALDIYYFASFLCVLFSLLDYVFAVCLYNSYASNVAQEALIGKLKELLERDEEMRLITLRYCRRKDGYADESWSLPKISQTKEDSIITTSGKKEQESTTKKSKNFSSTFSATNRFWMSFRPNNNIVHAIDKFSQRAFPISFFVFNFVYMTYYSFF